MRHTILQEGFSGNSEEEALRRMLAQETKLLRSVCFGAVGAIAIHTRFVLFLSCFGHNR